MSKGGRGLTDDEKKLWRRVAASVRARRKSKDEPPDSKPPLPAKRAAPSQSRPAPSKPRAAAPPVHDRRGEKRVRRGKLEIGGSLDLHGHNQVTGHAALVRFLRAAHARGDRTVIVITGAGRTGPGVLRQRLPEWLAKPELRGLLSGFAQAHRTHGGDGAFYVFLRRADAR